MFKEERPPQFSSPTVSTGSVIQRRWVPPSQKRNVVNTEEHDNAIFRKVRGILNKLTPEKFDKLSLELLNIGIDNKHILKGIILLIFEKALDEPKYSSLYAQLCHRLCEDAPNFEAPSSKITSFKRLLLNKCQDEFENRSRAFEAFDKDVLTPDEEEQEVIAKHKMLGNIKFIGELGKLDMLHEAILHRCIQQLLEKKKKNTPVEDLGEDYECLCQILRTTGKSLDHDKARLWMDQYFDRIKTIMSNPELPSRIRFMLLDIVELRNNNNWSPRKIYKDTGPKTIQQVRMDAIKEYGITVPNSAMGNLTMNTHTTDMFGRPVNGSIGPPRSMMGDIFGPMSPPFMGSHSGIGTGPGVVDDFTPSFMNSNPRHKNPYNPDFKGGQYSGRGKPQDNKGRNSPRFDRYNNNNSPTYHREKEADIDPDEVHEDYGMRKNHDGYNNRYNNRDNRGQGQRPYFNRNQQNKDYRSQDGTLQPRFPTRQRSPYNMDDQGDRSRDNRSPGNSWRDKREDQGPGSDRDSRNDIRDRDGRNLGSDNRDSRNDNRGTPPYRGSYNRDSAPANHREVAPPSHREGVPPIHREGAPQEGREWARGREHEPRRDNWEKNNTERQDREKERPDKEVKPERDNREQWERDNREKRERDFPKVIKRDELEARDRSNSDRGRDWDSFDGDRRDANPNPAYNRDFQKGGFDRDSDRDFRNGDISESRDKNRFDNDSEYRPRDGFNPIDNRSGDFRSNNRDFRDFRDNRDNRDKDFRDFRDNHDGPDFRDNRGFRDFGERGAFDNRPGGFLKPRDQQPQGVQRELPPRFQRKQLQQQHATPDPLFSNDSPTPPCPPDDPMPMSGMPPMPGMHPGAPPQRFRHPLHTGGPPHPGFFPPRFPPPGGPPMLGPPPRGFPMGPPPHMAHPRFPMNDGGRPMDRDLGSPRERDGGILTPGGPGQSPPQNLPKGPAKIDEISLRPARNFPTLLRPSTPNMLPKSAQSPHSIPNHQIPIGPDLLGPGPGGPQPIMKTTNLTIKQVHAPERNKDRRKVPNKEELKQATDDLMKTFLEKGDIAETVKVVKDMRPPRRFMPEMISMMIVSGLERGDQERENISKLIQGMKDENILASDLYLDGLCLVLDRMGQLEQEIPLVKSNVAKFAAQAVGGDIMSLSILAEPLQNGAHYPFFLLCLQQLHKVRDKEWLVKAFSESRIELLAMLPECDRTKERMVDILEDRNLSFMFPLLRVQSDLWRVIRSDPNPTNVYKWIKENVDTSLQTDPGFIDILVTNLLRYVTSESTLKEDQDPNNPDKAAIDKETGLIDKFKGVLARFLLDRVDLQMTAIYAMQVFGHSVQFPKGLMLRIFMNMYDLEIVDEETFLKWKEEVNDEYPGKGKVLFQVHQWLTWLEQAEEESEEEDN